MSEKPELSIGEARHLLTVIIAPDRRGRPPGRQCENVSRGWLSRSCGLFGGLFQADKSALVHSFPMSGEVFRKSMKARTVLESARLLGNTRFTSNAAIFHSGSSRTSRPSLRSGAQINPDKTPTPAPFTINLWMVTVSFTVSRGFSSNLT